MEPISWEILVVEVATFLVGAVALWFIAYRPIKRILAQRKERIAAAQADAEKARRQAEHLQKALEKRLAKLGDDYKKRMNRAEVEARKLRDGLVNEAREQAQEVVKQGREQLKRERGEMAEALRRDVARASVQMARRVSGAMLKQADRKRLMQRVLDELPRRFEGKA